MQAQVKRRTKETDIAVDLKIDGSGEYEISTTLPFLDHLLASFAKHGRFDLKLQAEGDHEHHIAEDVALVLGQAFREALGDKHGIRRFGHAIVPMDDVLVLCAVDIGGRSYCSNGIKFRYKRVEGLSTELIGHFLESFASKFRINLHTRLLEGKNEHHKAEALFKALGLALSMALERRGRGVPSTKGVL
ncbi:imidazoleglycerol-phosphate dehydratase HisB [Candidatus Pyrohabitans sp.]